MTESEFQIKVDGQTRESWDEIIDHFTDANIYQTWAYGAVRWGADHLSHLTLFRNEQILAAAQLRIARLPLIPAGIAYLRWGPLCHLVPHELNPLIVKEMMARLQEEYCKRRRLILQIIPNAYRGDVRGKTYKEMLSNTGLEPEPHVSQYRTILVDLSPELDRLRKSLDQKWRNQLNRSEKNGLELQVSNGREAYQDFVLLYRDMWNRKRFETSVDVEEFDRIRELLSITNRMQIFLAKIEGQSIAALICSLFGDTGIYLLGATNEKARELKAAYFLQWQAMKWLKDRGARWYDLGGIDPETNPGGYHFKDGFGGKQVTQLAMHSGANGHFKKKLSRWILCFHKRLVSPGAVIRPRR